MDNNVTMSPEVIAIVWKAIDRLPDNLHDFNRDPFGMGNLLAACGFELELVDDPQGTITVTSAP